MVWNNVPVRSLYRQLLERRYLAFASKWFAHRAAISPYCPHRSHRLMAFDLIPLLSYLMRGRRCKYCSKPISSRYFWVELLTGVLFVVLFISAFRHDAANAIADRAAIRRRTGTHLLY